MRQHDYADPERVARYPGVQLTDHERRRVDDTVVPIGELLDRPDLMSYAAGQALGGIVTAIFSKVEEAIGRDRTLQIARDLGREHGARNLRRFLDNRGLRGGPAAFAMYQDWGHSVRGPRMASALFAEYDERTVVVRRSDCAYFVGERGTPNPYVEQLEAGIVEGYRTVDPSLGEVANERCLCKGSTDGCEHRFSFAAAP